jgi:hypothetical protein
MSSWLGDLEEKNEVLVHGAPPFGKQGVGDQFHPCFLPLVLFECLG